MFLFRNFFPRIRLLGLGERAESTLRRARILGETAISVNGMYRNSRGARYDWGMGTISSISNTPSGGQTPALLLDAVNSLINEDMTAVDHHIKNELK